MPPANQPQAGVVSVLEAIRFGRYPWWFPTKAQGLALDYFAYGTDFVPLTASLSLTNSINISGDSAFCILSAVLVETATDNTTFLAQAPILFALQDTGSGRALSNIPIHASNWFGTAQEPKYWDIPKILAPNATFNVTAQNLEAVNRNVRVTFHGFKIFGFTPN